MKRLLKFSVSWFLFSISRTFIVIGTPIGVLITIFIRIKDKTLLSEYFIRMAYTLDVFVNVSYGDIFNKITNKDVTGAYRYGNIDESISKVLGKTKLQGKEHFIEKTVSRFLNLLDKNHVEKAAQ